MHFIEVDTSAKCSLCGSSSELFYTNKKRAQLFYRCVCCGALFLDSRLRLSSDEEKKRYLEHNNDVDDVRYQEFVSPITKAVIKDFSSEHYGLDYGAGTGPVITKVLTDSGYTIMPYDPFFCDSPQLLDNQYNYIVCCEVAEHFYNPYQEFQRLFSLLKTGGKLYCMTGLYSEDIDFQGWRYKDDQTHVFIYRRQTIEWINNEFCCSDLKIIDNMAVFTR